MKIQNPHDKAAKDIFDLNRVSELLQLSLPKEVSEYLDYAKIKGEPDSFVDDKFKEYHSDFLFSIATRGRISVKVYLRSQRSPAGNTKRTDRIHCIKKKKGGIAMTTAEVLIEKGIEKGKLEDAEKMLRENLNINLICKITGLSQEQIQELQKNMSG